MHDPERMKSSRPSTLQIPRLLRFAGLMLLLGSVASASAQTVRERLKKDPGFRIYAVVFGVTATTNSRPPAVRLVEVGDISERSARSADAVKINVPDAYIKAAKKKIQAEPPEPKMNDGKPVEVFTYFFYVPGHPNVVVLDLDKPLDKQP
jgi:hypothetical protein